MATMLREKRREKKKPKEKLRIKENVIEEALTGVQETLGNVASTSDVIVSEQETNSEGSRQSESTGKNVLVQNITDEDQIESPDVAKTIQKMDSLTFPGEKNQHDLPDTLQSTVMEPEKSNTSYIVLENKNQTAVKSESNITDNYEYLNTRLQNIAIPAPSEISETREVELYNPDAYLKPSEEVLLEPETYDVEKESVVPSAPMYEQEITPQIRSQADKVQETKSKLQCMPIEEAINVFGGTEMSAVRMMSEREEAIVEAGPLSGPEHPLVDLLSTFKSSLRALENERSRLTCSFADEEKSRSSLWKIEKRHIHKKKQCKCGANVELKASYEHAELLKQRMPVARLKLEGLLRDVQDSYCHYQHAALLAYCQIEELIAETIESSKIAIREALSLVLQALRVSDDSVAALPAALQRWAAALVAALADERDISQLLFIVHHLFRQSRSVRWAARVVRPRIPDAVTAARALALIDTLLASPRLDAALECTEVEADEEWEEVSAQGAGGGVSEGALREIDLLALLSAFPLRDLVARILLFTHADFRQARRYEWGDARGGCDVLFACCGVRTLLAALRRATDAHAQYARLKKKLRVVGVAALEALSCLYQSPRAPYHPDMEEKIRAELEACFTAAFNWFGSEELYKLDTTLLAEDTAKDYCLTYMIGLHDTSPREVDSLLIFVPVLPCAMRVRILTAAAQRRLNDHELARIVLDFLLQTGGKVDSPSSACRGGCAAAARDLLSPLLIAHPYLRTVALYAVADLVQVSSLDPSIVTNLKIEEWRPQCDEMQAVLQRWSQRCPQLLHRLLLQLDCTPHTGLSLEVQVSVGAWVCARARSDPGEGEAWWRVLLRLRTHRACWGLPAGPPPPDPEPEPADLFSTAFALLSTSWGHSIPLICSSGVRALRALCSRPRAAVHCLAPLMLIMAQSPESVSLTPQFAEVFTCLLNSGPTLVQRALGRGGASGAELLLRLVLSQVEQERQGSTSAVPVFRAWLHGLWRVPLRAAASTLDTAALAARDWPALDAHAAILLQAAAAAEQVSLSVRHAAAAPLLAECLLRATFTQHELSTQLFPTLANLLWEQKQNGQKVHVDNALQKIKARISSEELVIYRSATAALAAPLSHPSHLALWRLFFHLYLQRPPANLQESGLPVGPLFFSGLIKSRMLTSLIKRLQDTAAYHHNEAETYKNNEQLQSQSTNRLVKSESMSIDKGLLPALSIKDFTGESSDSDSELSDESDEDSDTGLKEKVNDTSEVDKKHALDMTCFHTAAERMVRQFCAWLEDGENVRASPHHADLARFIPEQALEAAWKDALSRSRPPPAEELEEFPRLVTPPDCTLEPDKSPLDVAIHSIMKIKDKSRIRSQKVLRSPLEDVDVRNGRELFDTVDKHLKDIETFAKEWTWEANRISSLDSKLWELVATLRVPRPLPPVTVPCPNAHANKCRPILFYIEEREWCISTGAERSIKENRSAWVSAVRALSRARPAAARTAAALHSVSRRIRDKVSAVSMAERVWRAAGACAAHCPAARAALDAALQILAERWIRADADTVEQILTRWCCECRTPLQQALCGALVAPRHVHVDKWPRVYNVLLDAKLPSHAVFSYLSKFEMCHWSRSASPGARRELLTSLISAQTKYGIAPAQEHSILLELLGVHTAALVNEHELCAVVMKFARLAADGKLPPRQWKHLLNAVEANCDGVSFDQLGHLLRDLGSLWWEARAVYNGARTLVSHSEHAAAVQACLLRALQAAAVALSYQPERVGRCAWSALQESWSAWVAPHPCTPPLLPSLPLPEGDAEYTLMLRRFRACLLDVMAHCPGCESVVLQSAFAWSVACHAACAGAGRQEARLQASELLAALAALPWAAHQWFYGTCLDVATQICATNDREIMSWCCDRWSETDAVTLLRDVTDDTIASRLATLLYLFTGVPLRHHQHILSEARRLPWRRLPEPELGDALDRFFATHHDPTLPYHDLPQFQVILNASLLRLEEKERDKTTESRDKRARAVSAWVRAAAAPALHAHVAGHATSVLDTITRLAPHLDESSGEVEELLGRASVMMCMEPAAAVALPVWQSWVCGAPAQVMRACVAAACALTAPAYCALLADTAIRAYCTTKDWSWSEVSALWTARSPWREPQQFAERGCLHAAYACACAAPPPPAPHAATHALHALQTSTLHFVENEVIIAVWICYACRVALACATSATSESEACVDAARAVLRAWAAPPRRSILQVVTMQPDNDRSTPLHRILCRLAECVVTPSTGAVEAFEQACVAAGRSDVISWERSIRAARLPRTAARLYPAHHKYFSIELSEATDREPTPGTRQ